MFGLIKSLVLGCHTAVGPFRVKGSHSAAFGPVAVGLHVGMLRMIAVFILFIALRSSTECFSS